MSKLAKRLEQKTIAIAIANMVVDSYKVRIEAQKQNYGPVANLIAHLLLPASAESVIMCLAAQPTALFSTKSPRLDKRRVRRYNRGVKAGKLI